METKSKLNNAAKTVEQINFSSLTLKKFVESYQKNGIPVVISGLLQECDWNLDYLCDKLGKQKFVARFYGHERYNQDKRKWANIGSGVEAKIMSFTDYANLLRNHEAQKNDIYLAKCSIKNTPLANIDSLNSVGEQLGLKRPLSDLNLWIGPGSHVECLHYDTGDGTLIQLHGSKKIVLFPPSQLHNIYPFPLYVHLLHGLKLRSWFSQVYPENPDLKTFPKFQEALLHKYEVILNPGEILYIPAGWWHEVTALGNEMVCSVNRFWRVYPTSRAVFSWSRWRNFLGFLFGLPHTLFSIGMAIFSSDRKQKISKILQML